MTLNRLCLVDNANGKQNQNERTKKTKNPKKNADGREEGESEEKKRIVKNETMRNVIDSRK